MSSDDVVIINDDNQKDSDIEVIEVSKETRTEQKSTQDNPIIIDDDIIEIIDVDATKNNEDIKDYLTKVCSENKLIGEFVEKCLDFENSDGMLRVIYRTFLPLFFKMDDGYRESSDFKKVVDMTTRALEVNPNLKFTHLKFVCDIMKSKSRERKKVQFTTLSSNVTAKPTKPRKQRKRRKRRGKLSSVKKSKRRKTEKVIELDESSDAEDKCDEPPVSDPTTSSSNKENRILEQSKAPSVKDSNVEIDRANNLYIEWNSVSEASPRVQPGSCLDENIECEKKDRIKQIEKQIEFYKNLIDTLEQEEVKTDTLDSPYIKCERIKCHIVLLYKELCSLTGDDPVKKRVIHFTATDGRPQLPLKVLERFINENIGADGNPCLPDFYDVVDCVCRANESAGLGWDKPRIWNEARALFNFCGQALQDSRKKREWRYMIGLANSQLDDDPAERDPELMARLEANRRIAVKKELDLLDKYVKMEEGRFDGESIANDFQVSQDSDDEFEQNTFAASTSNSNNGNQAISTIVTNNVHSCRTVDEQNSERNMGYTFDSAVYRTCEQRCVNNKVQEMVVKQSHKYLKKNTDTRMLEISIDANQKPEVRVVAISDINAIENQRSVTSLLHNNKVARKIEMCGENNKPPEVINVAGSDQNNKGNVEQNSVTDNSTCLIEFDNSINEKFVEKNLVTFEDTYKDFVQCRAADNSRKDKFNNNSLVTSKNRNKPQSMPVIKGVYSAGSYQNGQCNSMNNYSESMPLLIKEVYSVGTKQIITTQNNSELGNKSLLCNEVTSKQNDPSTQSKISSNSKSRSDTSVSDNMPILIKDVYSVATKQNNSSDQDNSLGLDTEKEWSFGKKATEVSSENFTVALQNMVTEDSTAPNENDPITANTNSELPKANVEEENLIKVKTEVSDLLKEMENFGDSFTATVFDIEDPFLVIEISDSSDESDDDGR